MCRYKDILICQILPLRYLFEETACPLIKLRDRLGILRRDVISRIIKELVEGLAVRVAVLPAAVQPFVSSETDLLEPFLIVKRNVTSLKDDPGRLLCAEQRIPSAVSSARRRP